MSTTNHNTIEYFFDRRLRESGDCVAIHIPANGTFRRLTWGELFADVARMAQSLKDCGLQPGDRVAQVSENRYEWIVLDFAIHCVRGVHVAIHAPLSGAQIAFQIADSDARVVFLSGLEQARKLAEPGVALPDNLRFFSYEPCEVMIGGQAIELAPWSQAQPGTTLDGGSASPPRDEQAEPAAHRVPRQSLGTRTNPLAHTSGFHDPTNPIADLMADAVAHAREDDLATILYSSGTTGEPKGVMLTHGNLVSNARAMSEAFDVTPNDLRLTFLPLSHIFARTCDLYTWLGCGSQLALAESREKILDNCATLHSTMLNGVPYFYEKVMRGLRDSGQGDVPGKLVEIFGGRVRACCSGGAALPVHVAEWFERRGLPLLQGYGLTESSPVISMSTPAAYKNGTVGRALPGVEIKIADDGEILTRGPHVMRGYWKRPDATADAIRDGWLHTGDLGELDADGFLKITGRKKELIVTAAGKNIAPVAIEALLTEDPLILQAVVIGDGRNFLSGLIVPNPDVLREWIIKQAIPVSSRDEALRHPAVLDLYRRAIDDRLKCVSRQEQIGRFALLNRGFTIESGELTPTLKLRRGVIQANCAELIESLYAP